MRFLNKSLPLLRMLMLMAVWWNVPAWCCSVPVFRYALEKWPSDPYTAVVFHRGPLSEPQHDLMKQLNGDGLAGELHANISARSVDLDQSPTPEMLDLWQRLGPEVTPWLVVKYPAATGIAASFYSVPLTGQTIRQLIDSPARQEIAARLAQGESAVWLLLESGDGTSDTTAVELLEQRLDYLSTTLTLPKLDAQDVVNGLVSVPEESLRIGFSVLRLSREDPAEQAFVEMLLGTEPDLKGVKAPIAFPIFGRGRALYALVGSGIKHETIDRAASFLIGKCSCQVKEQNPGVDLLFAANWDAMLKTEPALLRDLPAVADLAKLAPVTVTISGSSDNGATSSQMPATVSLSSSAVASGAFYLLAATLFAAGILTAGVYLLRRSRRLRRNLR